MLEIHGAALWVGRRLHAVPLLPVCTDSRTSAPGLPPFIQSLVGLLTLFLVNSLAPQVPNTHRAEAGAGGEDRNKASLQFCLPHFTVSTEDCPSSTPCCPQHFHIWFWFKTSLHYSAWISVLHVVGLVLQDQSQGTFWGRFICFHLRWPIWRSGIFTCCMLALSFRYILAFLSSELEDFLILNAENSDCFSVRLVKSTPCRHKTGSIWLLAFWVCNGVTRNAVWLRHGGEGEANQSYRQRFACYWK